MTGPNYAAECGIKCADPLFQRFLHDATKMRVADKDEAGAAVRLLCKVQSRREFNETQAGAADDLQTAMDEIQERGRLLDNLSMTIAACVIASGGEVKVPKSVLEELVGYELEKAPGDPSTDIAVIYRTRRKGGTDA